MHYLLAYIAFFSIAVLSLRLLAKDNSIRKTYLIIMTLWSVLIVLSTEILSLFGAFTLCGLVIFWMITGILIGTNPLKFKPAGMFSRFNIVPRLSLTEKALLTGTALILLTTGLTALIAPPNNWDSMTYHMSRVAHWLQNKSVQFYPTSMPRQLWASPWAEYAIAQLQILSQNDRFANMVQWWSMLGSLIGVSLIAKALGASRRGQIVTAALCASIPVGILQSSSTQNDYAAAFWCALSVYFGLNWLAQPRHRTALVASLGLGLAMLTKSTTLLFLFPFFLWLTVRGMRLHSRKFASAASLLVAVPLVLNAPQFIRNHKLDGNIFSLTSESKSVTNSALSAQAVVSSALRYLGLNLCTSSEHLNENLTRAIAGFHKSLGWDLVDERFSTSEKYTIKQDIHEDNSCNTAHTLLLLLMTVLFAAGSRGKAPPGLTGYALSLAGGFILFCLMLKWQPWGNRLLLPLYVLSTPFLGTFFDRNYPRSGVIATLALLLLSIPWLTHNRSRPLVPKPTIFEKARNEQYFNNIPGEYFSYQRASEEIEKSGCHDIGLVMTSDSWEYPLWPLLSVPRHDSRLRIEHVNVQNPSQKYAYPLGDFDPCIAVHDSAQDISRISINGAVFIKTDQWAFLSLFRKDPDGKLNQLVRSASFSRMLQLYLESEGILRQTRPGGTVAPGALDRVMDLRRLAVQNAKMLDTEDLNRLFPDLGNTVKELFIRGNTLFMGGLYEKEQEMVLEGEQRLNLWNAWFAQHAGELQKLLQ